MKFLKPLKGHLGHKAEDPDANSDFAFYEWIAGTDDHSAVIELLLWLIEDLKKETDPERVRLLLSKWQEVSDDKEFENRILILEKLMPKGHPFHEIKKEFI